MNKKQYLQLGGATRACNIMQLVVLQYEIYLMPIFAITLMVHIFPRIVHCWIGTISYKAMQDMHAPRVCTSLIEIA